MNSYNGVKKDIEFYWPKVRQGGVMGGHDYNADYPYVAKAVIEFVEKECLELQGEGIDWWVVKR